MEWVGSEGGVQESADPCKGGGLSGNHVLGMLRLTCQLAATAANLPCKCPFMSSFSLETRRVVYLSYNTLCYIHVHACIALRMFLATPVVSKCSPSDAEHHPGVHAP